jgi:hypothetical protein
MLNHYETIIVGGGPAGLMAALAASEAWSRTRIRTKPETVVMHANPSAKPSANPSLNPSANPSTNPSTNPSANQPQRILVIEKGPRPGRKLLATGTGQCNITHSGDISDFPGHYNGGDKPPGNPDSQGQRAAGSAGHFLRPALYGFDNVAIQAWLSTRGVPCTVRDDGKVFPVSGKAADVLAALLQAAKTLDLPVFSNRRVESITWNRNHPGKPFTVFTPDATWEASTVVIAAGGHCYPALGSDGDAWRLAAGLGHAITEPGPALTPLYAGSFKYGACAGISLPERGFEIRRGSHLVARGFGDILITHNGLSGPGILDASRWMRPGDDIIIPFGDFKTSDAADRTLIDAIRTKPAKLVRTILAEYLPARLAGQLLVQAGVDAGIRAAQLTRVARQRLARGLSGEPIKIARLGDLDEAMASRGGIALNEVDSRTMMSRLVPGLFFAGEALDIDGDSGGYNLQAAFATGRLAGLSVVEFLAAESHIRESGP